MKKLYLSSVAMLIFLIGCGGEDSVGNKTSSNEEFQQPQSPILHSQDNIVKAYTGKILSVDLTNKNVASNNMKLSIHDIVNLSTNSQCDYFSVSGMTFILEAFDNPTMCQYKYSLINEESNEIYSNPRMMTHVIVNKRETVLPNTLSSLRALPSTTLPSIQSSVSVPGSILSIDLKSQLASLYPKDTNGKNYVLSNTILVLGSGSANAKKDDAGSSIVEYHSDSYDRGGITRLLYSLSDDFDGDGVGNFEVGVIDISVSSSGSNSNPETKPFQWTNNGADIKVGQKYTIDVASDISAECTYGREPQDTKGSCIYDADSNSLQIVGVYAYDAAVAPTSLIQLDNTKFDVTFNRTGLHDISYQVSDHFGGFATGIVRVYVKENLPPVLNKNPMIVYATENSTLYHGVVSSHATDLEGDTLSYKSVTQPESGKVTVSFYSGANEAAKGSLMVTTSPDSEGVHPFDVVITDGQNDVTQHWLYVVNSSTHLSLKDVSERTFATNVNTAITIDLRTLIQGYITSGEADTIIVANTAGTMLGNVSVDENEKYKLIYTPNKNDMGVDDFIFEVRTNTGATVAGNIVVHIGNPPPLEITSIDAKEIGNNVVSASVSCMNCDLSKYEYVWLINNQVVSTLKNYTLTPYDRKYDITLMVKGEDVYGQTDQVVKTFNFFNVSYGTFNNPAQSCQDIFEAYNDEDTLLAKDGEYWLHYNNVTYLTQCDMVDASEASILNKVVGGYTLIWSYSEATNVNLYKKNDGSSTWSQNGTRLSFSSDKYINGLNMRYNEGSRIEYNNFRLSKEIINNKFSNAYARVSYTSNPYKSDIGSDTDYVVQRWYAQTTKPVNFFSGQSPNFGPLDNPSERAGLVLMVDGYVYTSQPDPSRNDGVKLIRSQHGLDEEITDVYVAGPDMDALYFGVNSVLAHGYYVGHLFGSWVANAHNNADLTGVCLATYESTLGGVKAPYCNRTLVNKVGYHRRINDHDNNGDGDGYVIQWWAR